MKKQDARANPTDAAAAKAERLKAALKANLNKRKVQARARKGGTAASEQKQD